MFFEREEGGERALVVHIRFPQFTGLASGQDDVEEFHLLCDSAGAEVLASVGGKRNQPHPKTFVGSGKLDEIAQLVKLHEIELVLFNHQLSPTQERNLEAELCCRVVDRTGLILDIFALRARTFEGKLQVELAQLRHLSTRLVRGWTHLERQKGGIGLRGPGESQLETDRRLVRVRISHIQKRLQKVSKQREQGRRSRQRSETPTVSLVGYTNAGKSTLFNALTKADVLVQDLLFATLDPTFRKVSLPQIGETIFADTVGFIRDLPHDLVEAFSATLQESREADLLLHIVDASAEDSYQQVKDVESVLKQIGADEVPTLMVYNKIDSLADNSVRLDRDGSGNIYRVWVSAREQMGIEELVSVIAGLLSSDMMSATIRLKPNWGKLRAWCFQQGAVIEEEVVENGDCLLKISLPTRDFEQALRRSDLTEQQVLVQ